MKAFLLQRWIVLAGFRLGSAGTGLAALRCFQCSLSVKVADFRQYQCKRFLKSFYLFIFFYCCFYQIGLTQELSFGQPAASHRAGCALCAFLTSQDRAHSGGSQAKPRP